MKTKNVTNKREQNNTLPSLQNRLLQNALTAFIAFTFTMMSLAANANPTGGIVTAGTATIAQPTAVQTTVTQTTDKAIIHWNSFNINAGEKTRFVQPSARAIILNRIDPAQGASKIFGQLSANGRVILVNQAGIYFGPGSHVDVGGLIASAVDIKNENFLNGKLVFDQNSEKYSGSVINQGTIIAANHGLVALVGNSVSNEGKIYANTGEVVLASGSKFTVSLTDDGLVNFSVDAPATKAGVDHNGRPLKNGVNHSGIITRAGSILLTAKQAEGVVDKAINMQGVAQATSVSKRNGVIILDGGNGRVSVSGRLDVTGKKAGERGGTIKILGKRVEVNDSAHIDASGIEGGGTILIGGNVQGKGPESNASYSYVSPNATISADAIQHGNGGKIIVWSDIATKVYGRLSAQGGALGGNGGFIETSGHYLDIAGIKGVDVRAPHGKTGEWLLDPTEVRIVDVIPTTTTDTVSYIYSGDLGAALHTANITVMGSSGGIYVDSVNNLQGTGAWETSDNTTLTLSSLLGGGILINTSLYLLGTGKSLVLNSDNMTVIQGSLDGNFNLTVNSGSGVFASGIVDFYAPIGTLAPLNSITTNGANTININTSSISTTGAQTYNAISSINFISGATALTGTQVNLNAPLTNLGAGILTLNNSANTSIDTLLAGSGGITKIGNGQLTLTALNVYTGPTAVNGGELILAGNGAIPVSSSITVNQGGKLTLDNSVTNVTDRISNTNTFTMRGGELVFKGNNVASTATETIGTLALTSGDSTITMFGGSGGSTTLTFASITRATRAGTVLFRGVGQTNGLAPGVNIANIQFTTPPSTGNGQLVGAGALGSTSAPIIPFAIGDISTSGVGSDFVTYDSVAGVRLLNRATEYSTSTAVNGVNLLLTNTSVSPDASATFNSLLLNNSTYTIGATGAAKTLTVTSGAIFAGTGTNIINSSSGRSTDVLSTGGAEGKIFAIGTLQHDISNINTSGVGWTKNAMGTYLENRASMLSTSYGSTLVINNGTMQLGVDNFVDTTALTVRAGATFDYNTHAQTVGTVTLEEGGTAGSTVSGTSGTLTLGGNVTTSTVGSGAVGATMSGNLAMASTRTFTVGNGSADNDLTISANMSGATAGITKSGAGTLVLSGMNTFGSTSGVVTISGGTLSVGSINNGGVAGNLGQASSAAARLVFSNGVLKYTGSSAVTDRAFTINAGASGNFNIDSVNTNLELLGASANTTGALRKSGEGTLTLSAANANTGLTTIFGGKLVANIDNALSSGGLTLFGSSTYDIGAFNDTVGVVTLANGNITGTTGVLTGSSYAMTEGTVSAILGGTGGLTASNSFIDSVVTLTRANTYSGGTTINNGGVIVIGNNAALGSGAVTINNGGMLKIPAGSNISNTFTTIKGSGVGEKGALYFQGAGTSTLSGSIVAGTAAIFGAEQNHTVNFTNNIAVNGNTLAFQTDETNNINFNTISGDGSLIMDNIGDVTFNTVTGATPGNLNLQIGAESAGTLTFNGAISGDANIFILNSETAAFNASVNANQFTVNAADDLSFNNTLSTVGDITLDTDSDLIFLGASYLNSSTGNINLTSGDRVLQSAGSSLITDNTLTVQAANGILLNSNDNSVSTFNATNTTTGDIQFSNSTGASLTITSIDNANGGAIQVIHDNEIKLNGIISALTDITLVGTKFTNNTGSGALLTGPSGRFLIWSDDPSNNTIGGLDYQFKQYNATYGVSSVEGTDNGFLYTLAPIITPSLVGSVDKVYDATTLAVLSNSNYSLSGVIGGDTVILNNPTGNYADASVGNNKNVAVSNLAMDSAYNGSVSVYGYQLSTTSVDANIGNITPAPQYITGLSANNTLYNNSNDPAINSNSSEETAFSMKNSIASIMQQPQINFKDDLKSISLSADDSDLEMQTKNNGNACKNLSGLVSVCGSGIKLPANILFGGE